MPTCGPWRGTMDGRVRPSIDVDNPRPLRGAKPREADDIETSKGIGLLRLAPREQRFLCKAHLARFG